MAMPATPARGALLSAPELRSGLVRFIRGRVAESDVEDVVQATLADAFAARDAPEEAEELRRWVFGIAKHKVVDVHRRGGRELPRERVADEAAAESAPMSARDLLRWAEEELPEADDAKSTLEWMLREGDGEKLEHIAEEAELPAPRVRQRVSRMRKYFRSRWAAQLAAAATITLAGLAIWAWLQTRDQAIPEEIAREVPPDEKVRELRRVALEGCQSGEFVKCIEGLDRAKAIDPVGDQATAIQEARAAAARGLAPAPSVVLLLEPSSSVAPPAPAPQNTAPMKGNSFEPISPPKPPPPELKKLAPEKGSSIDFEQQKEPMPQKKTKAPPNPDFGSK